MYVYQFESSIDTRNSSSRPRGRVARRCPDSVGGPPFGCMGDALGGTIADLASMDMIRQTFPRRALFQGEGEMRRVDRPDLPSRRLSWAGRTGRVHVRLPSSGPSPPRGIASPSRSGTSSAPSAGRCRGASVRCGRCVTCYWTAGGRESPRGVGEPLPGPPLVPRRTEGAIDGGGPRPSIPAGRRVGARGGLVPPPGPRRGRRGGNPGRIGLVAGPALPRSII